ncbi:MULTISPECIES: ferric reductase-like transmembrane domain-containing protein [Streptomyces]|uniref:ferric reductase-like transmembrane domain-containing protein n=1 Tax=Streptomyces TaxID=1883 RepID=UPI0010E966A9
MTASTLRAARPDRREQLVDAMTGRGALFTLLIASFLPFLTPLADLDAQRGTARQAGLVVGSLALMTLWWQVILGVRRVSQVLRMDRATAVRVHAALGTAGVLLVLLHPLLMAGTQNRPLAWLWQLDFRYPHNTFVTFGKLAAALFAVVWISSTIAKRLIRYRSWRAMHLLTYPLAVLVFAHSWGVRTLISDSVFVNAYWWVLAASLAAAMGLQLIHRLRPASGHASTIGHDGDVRIVEVSVPPRLQPAPGQFVYVRSTRLGRAHPFSPIGRDEHGRILLAVEPVGPFTRAFAVSAQCCWVDGPYGSFLDDDATIRVYIAGGIGVTPFVDHLTSNGRLHLYHLARSERDLAFSRRLSSTLGPRFYHPVLSGRGGRMRADDIPRPLLDSATFFICGRRRFVTGWREQLKDVGVESGRIRSEVFEWP